MPEFVRNLKVRISPRNNVERIHRFYASNESEFLVLRSIAFFEELLEENSIFEIYKADSHSEEIVGLCYIKISNEQCDSNLHRAEFGGVFVSEAFRGSDVPDLLGAFALSQFALHNISIQKTDITRIIAHVHQLNPRPRSLLRRLCFRCVGAEIPPLAAVPGLKLNKFGYVIGYLYALVGKAFTEFGSSFEKSRNRVIETKIKNGTLVRIEFDLPEFLEWSDFWRATRELAVESSIGPWHFCWPCSSAALDAWLKAKAMALSAAIERALSKF